MRSPGKRYNFRPCVDGVVEECRRNSSPSGRDSGKRRSLSSTSEADHWSEAHRGKGYRLRRAEVTVCKAFDGTVTVLQTAGSAGASARGRRGGGSGGGREDRCSTRGPGQGRAAVATGMEVGAGPPVALAVQAGGDRGGGRMGCRAASGAWRSVAPLPPASSGSGNVRYRHRQEPPERGNGPEIKGGISGLR